MEKPQKKLLIVDDDNDIIDLVSIYLEDEFEIHSALNADDAQVLLKDQSFDLIVVDIFLPRIDGKELIKIIRKDEQRTPILAISGYLQRDVFLSEIKEIGADDFMEKPFLLGSFLNTISRLTS